MPLDAIIPGDRLLIRQGDVAPLDGTVAQGQAAMDHSALTGEAMPVRLGSDDMVISGATNAGEAFDLKATHPADQSTYAGIVRLVKAAQKSKAPMSRLADRYALLFLAVTVVLAGAAWWFTGDPIRAVTVLVVATPCPLILAVPVALVAGLSRAAKYGVLIKGSKALEALAGVRTLIFGQDRNPDRRAAADRVDRGISRLQRGRGFCASQPRLIRYSNSHRAGHRGGGQGARSGSGIARGGHRDAGRKGFRAASTGALS